MNSEGFAAVITCAALLPDGAVMAPSKITAVTIPSQMAGRRRTLIDEADEKL